MSVASSVLFLSLLLSVLRASAFCIPAPRRHMFVRADTLSKLTLGTLEEGYGASTSSIEVKTLFHDEELIAPPNLSRYLVLTAHALLITAGVSLWMALRGWSLMWGCCTLSFLVYVTSVLHWRHPRFDSLVRKLDVLAVIASLAFASYVAASLGGSITELWFSGVAGIGCIFAANELKFYLQIGKAADSGPPSLLTTFFPPTLPGTREREGVYRLNVLVHGLCVHVGTNVLALSVILLGRAQMLT